MRDYKRTRTPASRRKARQISNPHFSLTLLERAGIMGNRMAAAYKERRHPAGKFATVIDRRYIRLGPAIRREACQKCTGETPALLGKQALLMNKPFLKPAWQGPYFPACFIRTASHVWLCMFGRCTQRRISFAARFARPTVKVTLLFLPILNATRWVLGSTLP